jgi:hypothetical protein
MDLRWKDSSSSVRRRCHCHRASSLSNYPCDAMSTYMHVASSVGTGTTTSTSSRAPCMSSWQWHRIVAAGRSLQTPYIGVAHWGVLGNVSPNGPCRPILLRDTTKEYGREEDGVSNIQSATVYLPSLVLSSTYPPP